MPNWNDVRETKSPLVKALHEWWMAKRGASGIPDRNDLDPIALTHLLPNLIISEVETDGTETGPFRIRYRLVGTKVVAITSFDFTGRYLDELLADPSGTPWVAHYATVYKSRTPIFGSVTERTTNGSSFTYEYGIFPLTLNGGSEVQQFVSIEDYFDFNLTSAELQAWPRP